MQMIKRQSFLQGAIAFALFVTAADALPSVKVHA